MASPDRRSPALHLLLSTAAAALCLGALLAASTQTSRTNPRANMPIALTGCLQTSAEPRVFLLTNAVRADEADEGGADQADEGEKKPAAAAAKTEGRTYRIVPLGAQLDLKSHVGERVDVGGRFVSTESLHGGPTSDAGKDKQSSSRVEKAAPPTVAVTYVRKVAATCGAAASDAKP